MKWLVVSDLFMDETLWILKRLCFSVQKKLISDVKQGQNTILTHISQA